MAYNAVEMADWQISEAAEANMPGPDEWREKLGLEKDEILPMGRLAKLDFLKIIDRLKDKLGTAVIVLGAKTGEDKVAQAVPSVAPVSAATRHWKASMLILIRASTSSSSTTSLSAGSSKRKSPC